MRLPSPILTLTLALSTAALAAACGPPEPPVTPPPPPEVPPAATAPAPASATPAASASAVASAPPPAPASTASGGTSIQPSKMLADVKRLGIDLGGKKVPSLESIPLATKKKLMPLFVKALGYESCSGCHVEGDFSKPTRNLKIARGMWDRFVAELRTAEGGGVFCDSCHAGATKNLNRADHHAVAQLMKSDYVAKLAHADGSKNDCATCHGDPFEPHILEKAWKVGK